MLIVERYGGVYIQNDFIIKDYQAFDTLLYSDFFAIRAADTMLSSIVFGSTAKHVILTNAIKMSMNLLDKNVSTYESAYYDCGDKYDSVVALRDPFYDAFVFPMTHSYHHHAGAINASSHATNMDLALPNSVVDCKAQTKFSIDINDHTYKISNCIFEQSDLEIEHGVIEGTV
jgi:hypothetical protein